MANHEVDVTCVSCGRSWDCRLGQDQLCEPSDLVVSAAKQIDLTKKLIANEYCRACKSSDNVYYGWSAEFFRRNNN